MIDTQNEVKTLKTSIIDEANRLGANIIGFAPVERWSEFQDTTPDFFPQNIWPEVKTVIVLALQIYLPMLETTPSVVYSELYNTTNRLLDDMAYKLANYLNKKGHKAFFFPRDCYGDISVLIKKPQAAFSHVLAGKYAGLGTIGCNHTLITKEFGPRVRLVSVLTDAAISPDKMYEKQFCVKCNLCKKCCPMEAFTLNEDSIFKMNKVKCAKYHQQLKNSYKYPCGVCTKVCPVGEDRKIYGMDANKYLKEADILSQNKDTSEYSGWIHCRSYGSD